jgi:hypothetical protein
MRLGGRRFRTSNVHAHGVCGSDPIADAKADGRADAKTDSRADAEADGCTNSWADNLQ